MNEPSELMRVALKAAVDAGEVIMSVYTSGEDFDVASKSDATPVTKADKASDRLIVERLGATGIPVLSEESEHQPYEQRKDYPRMWVVDPLDGTKEFIKRNDMFAMCIALVENHRPTLGVIYIPVSGMVYFAERGKSWRASLSADGSASGFQLMEIEALPLFQDVPHVVLTSLSSPSDEVLTFCGKLQKVWPDVERRGCGSSIKQCLIAEGSAAFYPRFGRTMEWDTAAGQVIIENAGGHLLRMSDLQPMEYNRKNLENPRFVASASGVDVKGLLSETGIV